MCLVFMIVGCIFCFCSFVILLGFGLQFVDLCIVFCFVLLIDRCCCFGLVGLVCY